MPVTITDMRAVAAVLGLKGTSKPDIATKVAEALKSKKNRDLADKAVSALAKKAGVKERKSARSTWDAIVAADSENAPKAPKASKKLKAPSGGQNVAQTKGFLSSAFGEIGTWLTGTTNYCGSGTECSDPKLLNGSQPYYVSVSDRREKLLKKKSTKKK